MCFRKRKSPELFTCCSNMQFQLIKYSNKSTLEKIHSRLQYKMRVYGGNKKTVKLLKFLTYITRHGLRVKYYCNYDIRHDHTIQHLIFCKNSQIGYTPRIIHTVYPKKYAHGFVVLCFVVVMQSFIMNSHEVFIHIHQGCFAGTGAIVRLPQCQWSKPDGYGKISQCITTTKHSKAKTVCIFLGIYCMAHALLCFVVVMYSTILAECICVHSSRGSTRTDDINYDQTNDETNDKHGERVNKWSRERSNPMIKLKHNNTLSIYIRFHTQRLYI